jgi:hypothetical protein
MEPWHIARIPPATLTWGKERGGSRHCCPHCGIVLLTGENAGFCCGPGGARLNDVPPLPPLPVEFNGFLEHPDISSLSRILNLCLSFASLETTHAFPSNSGPPGFFAVQGKVYHRIQPTHLNSAVRWLLYDGFLANIPHGDLAATLPQEWIDNLRTALIRVNPFVRALQVRKNSLMWCHCD